MMGTKGIGGIRNMGVRRNGSEKRKMGIKAWELGVYNMKEREKKGVRVIETQRLD